MIWVIYDMIKIARNNFSSNKYIVSTEGNKTTWIYVVVSIQILYSDIILYYIVFHWPALIITWHRGFYFNPLCLIDIIEENYQLSLRALDNFLSTQD